MENRKGWGMVTVAVVFAIGAISVALGTYFFENNQSPSFFSTQKSASPDDEDGDGLFTWEELAWHTDPKKADTDGDGAPDGAEIAAGTNPAFAGAAAHPYETEEGTTRAALFGLDIATAESAYGASGGGAEALQSATAGIAKRVLKPDFEERVPLSALKITPSANPQLYGEVIVGILQKSVEARRNELSTFNRAIQNNNFYGVPELKETEVIYRSITAALIAIEVPPEAANAHLKLVNSIGTMANIVGAMASWGGDPVAGIAYVDAFFNIEPRVKTDIAALLTLISVILQKV